MKIWCKHRAFHSFWEKEICFVLGKVTMKLAEIFRIDCFKGKHSVFKAVSSLKEPIHRNVMRISDFS